MYIVPWLFEVKQHIFKLSLLSDLYETRNRHFRRENLWVQVYPDENLPSCALSGLEPPTYHILGRQILKYKVIIYLILQALSLGSDYKKGKLLAYQLLCTVTVRKQEVQIPMEHLCRFYRTVHYGLHLMDQVKYYNYIIKYKLKNENFIFSAVVNIYLYDGILTFFKFNILFGS